MKLTPYTQLNEKSKAVFDALWKQFKEARALQAKVVSSISEKLGNIDEYEVSEVFADFGDADKVTAEEAYEALEDIFPDGN